MAINAKTYGTSSGTNAIHTGAVKFYGFSARNTTSATDVVLTVYDSLTATGTILYKKSLTASAPLMVQLDTPLQALTGISVGITGTTPTVNGSVYLD
jgi:hypothetical protein